MTLWQSKASNDHAAADHPAPEGCAVPHVARVALWTPAAACQGTFIEERRRDGAMVIKNETMDLRGISGRPPAHSCDYRTPVGSLQDAGQLHPPHLWHQSGSALAQTVSETASCNSAVQAAFRKLISAARFCALTILGNSSRQQRRQSRRRRMQILRHEGCHTLRCCF